MRLWPGSLYGRIAALFLVLLLVFGAAQVYVSVRSARQFARESDQSLNRHLARDLVPTFRPALAEGLDRKAVARLMQRMMVFNPRIEIYVLAADGTIAFAGDKPLAREGVSLKPVRAFLSGTAGGLPILGDDPRDADARKPFSVAPVRIAGKRGYLYLILGGEQYESVAGMVEESTIIRLTLLLAAGLFLAVGAAGLAAFFLLTRRLRRMAAAVRAFEAGDHTARVPETARDEIGQLGRAFNDLADRVTATLEQLRHADAMRRELVANVSHDLRSPLASVRGYLETLMMKDAGLSAGTRREYLDILHRSVLRLGRLVDSLFELSRLEARQVALHREPFALAELVQDVLRKLEPQASSQGVHLRAEGPERLPLAVADIGLIERVLTNLVDNALNHTPRHGEVVVHLAPAGEGVRVQVADTGLGIPPEELPHVFERFYRVDKARSRAAGGSGLGLAIARSILDQHEVPITVESAPGRGTTFTFVLPARPSSPADETEK